MRTGIVLSALVCLTTISRADEAASKKYLESLQGTWSVTSMQKAGMDAPEELVKSVTIEIKGDSFLLKFSKQEERNATLVVDPSQKPVALDLTPKDGPNAGKPLLGLVSLEKGVLTMVWNDERDSKTRPKEFSSTKENKQLLIVLKKGS